jgi:hypothetical protein
MLRHLEVLSLLRVPFVRKTFSRMFSNAWARVNAPPLHADATGCCLQFSRVPAVVDAVTRFNASSHFCRCLSCYSFVIMINNH